MEFLKNKYVRVALIVGGVLLALFLLNKYMVDDAIKNEGVLSDDASYPTGYPESLDNANIEPNVEGNTNLNAGSFEGLSPDAMKNACFPVQKELSSKDLLPKNELQNWSENTISPDLLKEKNFLSAGHHIGINTVGQSLRNANYGLRSEPANPQIQVSPFLQSTIVPDLTRRPLEIGGCM